MVKLTEKASSTGDGSNPVTPTRLAHGNLNSLHGGDIKNILRFVLIERQALEVTTLAEINPFLSL